jgi:hypothetical protein
VTTPLRNPYEEFIPGLWSVISNQLSAERRAQKNMSTQEVFVQQFARLFHHYHEALSPESEQTTQAQLAAWNSVPPDERDRMMEAARLAIVELESNARPEDDSRKYYAKPGEAEWGC